MSTSDTSRPVREFFESQVASYASNFQGQRSGGHFCFRSRLETARQCAAGISGRLLDCACGSGEITAAVMGAGQFDSAVIADISESMLGQARAALGNVPHAPPCSYVNSDIFELLKTLGGQDPGFDLVLCLGLIAHTGRLEELLRLQRACLAPGGRILLQSTLLDHPGTRLTRALTARRYERQKGYPISYYRLRDLETAAAAAGLRVGGCHRFGLGLPFGDKLWAAGNFFLETKSIPLARRWGSEVVLVLTRES